MNFITITNGASESYNEHNFKWDTITINVNYIVSIVSISDNVIKLYMTDGPNIFLNYSMKHFGDILRQTK